MKVTTAIVITMLIASQDINIAKASDIDDSMITKLKQQELQKILDENAIAEDKQKIAIAMATVEQKVIDYSFEFFNELKNNGINFRKDIPEPSSYLNPACHYSNYTRLSDGEFIVGAFCGTFVKFWPIGMKDPVHLSATKVWSKTKNLTKFDDDCEISLSIGVSYKCNETTNNDFPGKIRTDLRKEISRQINGH